jgi:hypothetical protein
MQNVVYGRSQMKKKTRRTLGDFYKINIQNYKNTSRRGFPLRCQILITHRLNPENYIEFSTIDQSS